MAPPDPNDYVILEISHTAYLPRFDLVGFVDPDNGYSNGQGAASWSELEVLEGIGIGPVVVPPTAVLEMNTDRNHRPAYPDWVTPVLNAHTYGTWVVNGRIKSLFEPMSTDIEFLPVPVVDKKKAPLGEPYFFFRPLTEVDCIDRAKSKIIWEEDNPESIDQVNELVILANKLPEKSAFFRIKYLGGALVVHKKVVDALAALRAQPFEIFPLLEYMTGPTGQPTRHAWDGTSITRGPFESRVTEFDPPAKTKTKKAPKVKSPPFPKVLDPWVNKPVRLMTTGGEVGWSKRDAKKKWIVEPIDGVVFCWGKTSKMLRELLLEAMGPAAQEEVLEGALVPFAVLGNTEESGEKLTLENLLDVQNEGVLLYDAALAVHHDDEGHLSAKEVKVQNLKVTSATAVTKKKAAKKAAKKTAPKKKKRK